MKSRLAIPLSAVRLIAFGIPGTMAAAPLDGQPPSTDTGGGASGSGTEMDGQLGWP